MNLSLVVLFSYISLDYAFKPSSSPSGAWSLLIPLLLFSTLSFYGLAELLSIIFQDRKKVPDKKYWIAAYGLLFGNILILALVMYTRLSVNNWFSWYYLFSCALPFYFPYSQVSDRLWSTKVTNSMRMGESLMSAFFSLICVFIAPFYLLAILIPISSSSPPSKAPEGDWLDSIVDDEEG